MTRKFFIERVLRLIYGGQPPDDSEITSGLVNSYINDAIGVAIKACYKDALAIDGIGYLNNSFYASFSNITLSQVSDEIFNYTAPLPQIPYAIGRNEGVASVKVYNSVTNSSIDLTPLSVNQLSYMGNLPKFGMIYYWYEGSTLRIATELSLYPDYKIRVRMVSGGNSSDLNSELNVPDEYYPIMTEYLIKMLGFEKAQMADSSNDGVDNK